MTSVRTVLGDVPASDLGRVNYHEHLFQVSPLLLGDELDDEECSKRETDLLRQSGFEAFIDATPCGLGRRPAALARVAASTGVHIVMTTGVHRQAHYDRADPLLSMSVESLAATFATELTVGIQSTIADPTPTGEAVRAGILKVGIDYWKIDDFSRAAISAAGLVHQQAPAPVMIHLEHGTAGHEVLDLLGAAGVRSDRVVLAHIDRNPDSGLHIDLASRGAYLGYDGAARHREWPDSVLLDCLERVASGGQAQRILLGGDVARRSRYRAYGGMPGLEYLGQRFVPRVEERVGRAVTDMLLRDNPARLLAWE